MTDTTSTPSMDDILASIRRIIAEEDATKGGDDGLEFDGEDEEIAPPVPASAAAPPPRPPASAPPAPNQPGVDLEPLELTDPVGSSPAVPRPIAGPALVSDSTADASRLALATLSSLVVAGGQDNTLEGLVREMLRPMLKAWLDERLPTIVEAAVAREVARIAGKGL
jgi:cell pole-organizing protein PopZ